MNRITIEIKTGNESFSPDPGYEIARILETLAKRFKDGGSFSGALQDYNGNTVGTVRVTDDR